MLWGKGVIVRDLLRRRPPCTEHPQDLWRVPRHRLPQPRPPPARQRYGAGRCDICHPFSATCSTFPTPFLLRIRHLPPLSHYTTFADFFDTVYPSQDLPRAEVPEPGGATFPAPFPLRIRHLPPPVTTYSTFPTPFPLLIRHFPPTFTTCSTFSVPSPLLIGHVPFHFTTCSTFPVPFYYVFDIYRPFLTTSSTFSNLCYYVFDISHPFPTTYLTFTTPLPPLI